jgi:hypothetical protein
MGITLGGRLKKKDSVYCGSCLLFQQIANKELIFKGPGIKSEEIRIQ